MLETLNGRSAASVESWYYCASTRLPLAFDKHYKFCIIRFSLSFLVRVFLVRYSIKKLSGLVFKIDQTQQQAKLKNEVYCIWKLCPINSNVLKLVLKLFYRNMWWTPVTRYSQHSWDLLLENSQKVTTNTPIVCVLWKRADERCSSFVYKKSLNNAFSPKNVCNKKYY